jgi:hypothetical protein
MTNNDFMNWWQANQNAYPTYGEASDAYYWVRRNAFVDAGMARHPTLGCQYFAAVFHDRWIEQREGR